jgi:hypothetical protein
MGRRNLIGSAVLPGYKRIIAALPARKARDRIFKLPNNPGVSVVLLRFDGHVAALLAEGRRSFGWLAAVGAASACRASLEVWARTPRLRVGFYDQFGSFVLLGFNRIFAPLPVCFETRRMWSTIIAPGGACHVRLDADDRVFKFPDVDFRLYCAQGRPLLFNLPLQGEACSLVHDRPYLDGVVTDFLYFLRQSCVVILHFGWLRLRLEIVRRAEQTDFAFQRGGPQKHVCSQSVCWRPLNDLSRIWEPNVSCAGNASAGSAA